MSDRPSNTSSTKAEASSSGAAERARSRRAAASARHPLIDDIIDLNASVTRFNQQVLSSVFGVLSDVLDRANDADHPARHKLRESHDVDAEIESVKDRSTDAISSGLAELSERFDRAAMSVRRKSGS
jgi:hypothetical protein